VWFNFKKSGLGKPPLSLCPLCHLYLYVILWLSSSFFPPQVMIPKPSASTASQSWADQAVMGRWPFGDTSSDVAATNKTPSNPCLSSTVPLQPLQTGRFPRTWRVMLWWRW
jgi:hypothetical protein